jgi:hypothetical protein
LLFITPERHAARLQDTLSAGYSWPAHWYFRRAGCIEPPAEGQRPPGALPFQRQVADDREITDRLSDIEAITFSRHYHTLADIFAIAFIDTPPLLLMPLTQTYFITPPDDFHATPLFITFHCR